jgi:hypothetical protein
MMGSRFSLFAFRFSLFEFRVSDFEFRFSMHWYNRRTMTLIELTYELQAPLSDEQLRRLGAFANTYGLRRFRVDETGRRLTFEYDASRLKRTQVVNVLSRAKIAVLREIDPLAA